MNTLEARFWAKVRKTRSCWLWTAFKNHKGYGRFMLCNTGWMAHRLSWVMHNGPIPDGMWVLHSCDTPACIKPGHLFLGTNADNVADSVAKGRRRFNPVYGEQHGHSKLTEAQVYAIRKALKRSYLGIQRDLALRYNVSKGLINQIHLNRIWRKTLVS